MYGEYERTYRESIQNPLQFWGKVAQELVWHKPFETVLDESQAPFFQWFTGGELNTCYNALDFHVQNGRCVTAMIWNPTMLSTLPGSHYPPGQWKRF